MLSPFTSFNRAALCAVVIMLAVAPPARAQSDPVVDEIVVVVGDEIILRSEVDGYTLGAMQQQQLEYSDQLWVEALNQLINQQVLAVHAARDTTITVSDEQVSQALDERIRQLTQQVGSEARLEELYGKSVVQIKADLRQDFRKQLLADQFRNNKLRQIRTTPSEVEAWFSRFPADSLPTLPTTVRLAHIVRYPTVSERARLEAREVIEAIRDSIVVGGASLEELARRYSDDPGSVESGGRYTGMELGSLVPEFAAVASRLPVGELSQPFETSFGYHILRVNERQGDAVDFNHILIRIDRSQADPTEALNYLSTLRDSVLTHNVPFERLARTHSEEDFSKERGGRVVDPQTGERDLILGALGPTWQGTLDTLEVNEISRPSQVELLDGTLGYHIVLLQARTPEHRVSLATDYARIEQYALQEKRSRVLGEWLNELRQDVYIELRGKASELTGGSLGNAAGLTRR